MADEYGSSSEDTSSFTEKSRQHQSPYVPQPSEEKSIAEVEKMLHLGDYDKETAQEHILYLQHLENKFLTITAEEVKAGIVNEILPERITKIQRLLSMLKPV